MRPIAISQGQSERDRVEVFDAEPLAPHVEGDPERGGDEPAVKGVATRAEPLTGIEQAVVLHQVVEPAPDQSAGHKNHSDRVERLTVETAPARLQVRRPRPQSECRARS